LVKAGVWFIHLPKIDITRPLVQLAVCSDDSVTLTYKV